MLAGGLATLTARSSSWKCTRVPSVRTAAVNPSIANYVEAVQRAAAAWGWAFSTARSTILRSTRVPSVLSAAVNASSVKYAKAQEEQGSVPTAIAPARSIDPNSVQHAKAQAASKPPARKTKPP